MTRPSRLLQTVSVLHLISLLAEPVVLTLSILILGILLRWKDKWGI